MIIHKYFGCIVYNEQNEELLNAIAELDKEKK